MKTRGRFTVCIGPALLAASVRKPPPFDLGWRLRSEMAKARHYSAARKGPAWVRRPVTKIPPTLRLTASGRGHDGGDNLPTVLAVDAKVAV